jgi:hypothetical protein
MLLLPLFLPDSYAQQGDGSKGTIDSEVVEANACWSVTSVEEEAGAMAVT